ncbi:hypothetical protein KT999_07055 [Proteus mirabilis]|uniref:Phage protein n=1 Tax=Proteus genomosp. 6 TaxID=1311820 RepID=A0ABV1L5I9_9GAMM|nr:MULTISPECIES: hypothetical protein [Proteus]AYY80692.1 hypothetical protein EGX81_07280 [Proteus vulgaris]EHF3471529.1 hypothetical protein [Proteus mirabilis]EKU7612026.1 hypothetical protein [Proteus mirabilis]EKV9969041.1 hypothetical protein [Proteus mirabilis]EKW2668163.1 hypothetical protein [Proteus mirabilis]
MIKTPIQQELEPIVNALKELNFKIKLQQELLIAVMSELPDGTFVNGTPFDLAIKKCLEKYSVYGDDHYDANEFFEECKALAQHYRSKAPVI